LNFLQFSTRWPHSRSCSLPDDCRKCTCQVSPRNDTRQRKKSYLSSVIDISLSHGRVKYPISQAVYWMVDLRISPHLVH
jgi:hypothetical protein